MELREHTPVFRAYAHRMHRQPPLFLVRSPRRFCHARQPGRLVGKLGRLVGMRVQGNQTIIVDACAARRGRFPPALDLDVHSRGGDPLASPSVHLTTTSLYFSLLHARTHSSSLFLSLQTPLTTASRLLSSFFYSLVNAPFVNRPRVGFRKIPIANRLGSLDWSI